MKPAGMRPFLAAVRFLTPVPVPQSWTGGARDFSHSVYYYPIVGLWIGGVAAAVCFGLDKVMPPLAASAILVCVLIAASRALHMDGLADTADGFLSSRPREQILDIMRDSHTGAMGVIAVAGVVVVKTALLTSVMPDEVRWQLVLLMPLAGRCAMTASMGLLPYARKNRGIATDLVVGGAGRRLLPLWAGALLLAAGWLLAGAEGLAAAGASLGVGLLFALYCLRRIGGYTGDTLGATNELVECVPVLVGAIWA